MHNHEDSHLLVRTSRPLLSAVHKVETPDLEDRTKRTMLPESFSLGRGVNPKRLTVNWFPSTGFSSVILKNALESTNTTSQAAEIARIEAFLYLSVLGRISTRSINLDSRIWNRIRDTKILKGDWQLIADVVRFPNKRGKIDGLAPVYCLSPKYLMQIAQAEMLRGRYRNYAMLSSRRRIAQQESGSKSSDNIPAVLKNGTGLVANLEAMVFGLCDPSYFVGHPKTEGDSVFYIWKQLVEAWRILAPMLPNTELHPSWKPSKIIGWLYSSKPNLQAISSVARLEWLRGIDGQNVSEVDYSGSSPNMNRVLNGNDPSDDPYLDIVGILKKDGFTVSRTKVKDLLLPLFQGRTLQNYIYLWKNGEVSEDPRVVQIMLRHINNRGLGLMRAQGRLFWRVLLCIEQKTAKAGLPVFDSILTTHPDIAFEAMAEASMQEFGKILPCKVQHGGTWNSLRI